MSRSRPLAGPDADPDPSAKLPLSTTFKVHMAAGVQDLAGNSQGKSQDLTFTTVGAPTIQSVAPAPKEASVPVDTAIQYIRPVYGIRRRFWLA